MSDYPEASLVIAALLIICCVATILLVNGALVYRTARSCALWTEPKRLTLLSMALADVIFALFPLTVLCFSLLAGFATSCSVTSLAYVYCLLLNCVQGLGLLSLGLEMLHRRRTGNSSLRIRGLISFLLGSSPWIFGLTTVLPMCLSHVKLERCEARKPPDVPKPQVVASVILPACAAVLVSVMIHRGLIRLSSADRHWDEASSPQVLAISRMGVSGPPGNERPAYTSLPTLQAPPENKGNLLGLRLGVDTSGKSLSQNWTINVFSDLARDDANCPGELAGDVNTVSQHESLRSLHASRVQHDPPTKAQSRLSTFNVLQQHPSFIHVQQQPSTGDNPTTARADQWQPQIYDSPQPALSSDGRHLIHSYPTATKEGFNHLNPKPDRNIRSALIYHNPNVNEENRGGSIYSHPNPNEDDRESLIYKIPNSNEENRSYLIYSNTQPNKGNRGSSIYSNPNPNEENKGDLIYSYPITNEENRRDLFYSNPNPNEENRRDLIYSNPNPNEENRRDLVYSNPNPNEEERGALIYKNPNSNEENIRNLIYSNTNPNEGNTGALISNNPSPNEDSRSDLIYDNPNSNEPNIRGPTYDNQNPNDSNRGDQIYSNSQPSEDRAPCLIYDYPPPERTSLQRSLKLSCLQIAPISEVQPQTNADPPLTDTTKLHASGKAHLPPDDGPGSGNDPPLSADITDYQPRLFFDFEPEHHACADASKGAVLEAEGATIAQRCCDEEKGLLCLTSVFYLVYVIILASIFTSVDRNTNLILGGLIMVMRSFTTPILLFNYSKY